MMQAEGDQCAFDEAVQPGARITGGQHETAQSVDADLNGGPDVVHGDAHQQVNGGGDDGHETGAAEEGEHLGQLDLIEPVVQRRGAKAHQNAAEHAHLQAGHAQHIGGGARQIRRAEGADHGADGGVHDEEGDGGSQGRNFLFLLGHADGYAHGKDDGQVVEHHRAGGVEHLQNRVGKGAGAHQAHQAVGLQHGLVGQRAADAQKQAGHRQDGDGQHEGAAHTLQYAEDFVFHRFHSSSVLRPIDTESRCRWTVKKNCSLLGRFKSKVSRMCWPMACAHS